MTNPTPKRVHHTTSTKVARCVNCGRVWTGPSAHGVAARHHDATGHVVRVKVDMVVVYGTEPECELQVGLFDE